MLRRVFTVCKLIVGVIALAVLLEHGLPAHAASATVARDRHLPPMATVAPASHHPLAPCADHEGTLTACCFGSGCAVAGMALLLGSLSPIGARSAPGYAMPASERRAGIARIPGLHPPRRAA